MDRTAEALIEKQEMVGLWVAFLKEMPESGYQSCQDGSLKDACSQCYDAYLEALEGNTARLQLFMRDIALKGILRMVGTGNLLRGLWAFRTIATARNWTQSRLLGLDDVIGQAALMLADHCDDLRTGEGYLSVLKSLAIALDAKDKYTSSHCQTVQRISEVIADDLGVEIGYAGLFHDLGKIHVPDHILQKPGKLTAAEYDVVKQHSVHAYRILSPLPPPLPSLVLCHHERPDGRGYPLGLTEVPMPAAIVAVADTLHAIVSDRPYRSARPFEEALEIIEEVKGTQLRHEPVDSLNRLKKSVQLELREEVLA